MIVASGENAVKLCGLVGSKCKSLPLDQFKNLHKPQTSLWLFPFSRPKYLANFLKCHSKLLAQSLRERERGIELNKLSGLIIWILLLGREKEQNNSSEELCKGKYCLLSPSPQKGPLYLKRQRLNGPRPLMGLAIWLDNRQIFRRLPLSLFANIRSLHNIRTRRLLSRFYLNGAFAKHCKTI